MWPLFVWNVTQIYPGQFHARIMIEGFLTAFVVGFLGTALPRLLEVPRFTLYETLAFGMSVLGIAVLHARGETMWGDLLFVFTLFALVVLLATRALLFRRDNPPPAFILVAMGMLSALSGAVLQILSAAGFANLPDWCFILSKLLLYQGYLLFPVMGIGAFLLPRFFGLPNRQSFPESLTLSPEWRRGAVFALFCGCLVMASFAIEACGAASWGNGLRAVGVLLYFWREVPVHQAKWGGGSLALGLRVALLSIPIAYVSMAIWPTQAFSLIHILFITGFSLLTFIVASRVVLGHSGQTDRFRATIWPVLILSALLIVAMLTRVSADWMPDLRMSHYAYAAFCWAIGVVIWAVAILPGVRRAEEE